ncbi:peptidase inhibitor family I36 protein [Streptomyces tauricus]|uniref:peptidase inhibitor family I36 protein n=1 Tax=Streptomyces tauricus TaxID=68274 RepID=UPI0033B8C4EB
MRRLRSLLVVSAALAAVLGGVPAGAAATPAAPTAAAAAYSCDPGYFCMYSGWNGTGERCQYYLGEKRDTVDDCDFIQRRQYTLSVYNRVSRRVQYYSGNNHNPDTRVGSEQPGDYGNLQGSYQIRSMKRQ